MINFLKQLFDIQPKRHYTPEEYNQIALGSMQLHNSGSVATYGTIHYYDEKGNMKYVEEDSKGNFKIPEFFQQK
jgi:hypothetical protein